MWPMPRSVMSTVVRQRFSCVSRMSPTPLICLVRPSVLRVSRSQTPARELTASRVGGILTLPLGPAFPLDPYSAPSRSFLFLTPTNLLRLGLSLSLGDHLLDQSDVAAAAAA